MKQLRMNEVTNLRSKGFTLIELLLYVSLIGVVVLASSSLWTMLEGQRVKARTIREVSDQGAAAMQMMTQIIRNATSISAPTAGNSAASLTVVVPTGALSPTVMGLSGGVLQLTEGAAAAVDLTSSRVSVSSLSFSNLSRPGTEGTVRIQFTVGYTGPGTADYTYSKTFINTATLR